MNGPSAFPDTDTDTDDPLRAPTTGAPDYGSGLSAFPPDSSPLSVTMGQAAKTAPDTAARVFDLRLKTGLPADVIERNLADVEQQVASSSFDAETFRQKSPALASWLEQHPLNGAVAKDDLVPLQGMEKALRFGRNFLGRVPGGVFGGGGGLWRSIQGVAENITFPSEAVSPSGREMYLPPEAVGALAPPPGQVTKGNVNLYAQPKVYNPDGSISTVDSLSVNIDGKEVLLPTVTPDARHFKGTPDEITAQAVAEYEKTGRHLGMFATPEAADAYAQQLHEEYAAGIYEHLPMSQQLARFAAGSAAVAEHLAARVSGEAPRDAGFWERAAYSGAESIGQMIPAIGAGVLLGPEASLGVMGVSTGGQAYGQAREQGLSPERAATFGVIQGAIEVGTEWLPAHRLLGDLAKKTPIVSTIMHQLMPELAGEEIATALQDLNEWATLPANKERTFGDYLRERPSAAAMTAVSTLITIGGTTLAGHAAGRVFEQMGAAAQESKTLQRSPDAVRAFVEHATPDGHVYAPIDTFTEYWQSKGVNPADMATELTGDPAAYRTAVDSGQDLAIPTATYATQIANSEHNTFFSQELRLHPDEENAREASAREAETMAQLAEPAGEPSSASAVRAAVQSQLEAAGVPRAGAEQYATLYESAFGTLGERAGLDPLALFQRYGLTVAREGLEAATPATTATGASAAATAPALTPAQQRIQALSDEDLARMHESEDVADVRTAAAEERRRKLVKEGELRSLERSVEIDPKTGVGSGRALAKALPKAEANPNLSILFFDANNFGLVNKATGSHAAGDVTIKRIADAIRQAATEAGVGDRVFRPHEGGDEFLAIVPNEYADQVRQRAEELFGEEQYDHPEKGPFTVSLSGSVGATRAEAEGPLQAAKAARKAAIEALAKKARERAPNYAPSGLELIDADSTAVQTEVPHAGRPEAADRAVGAPADVAIDQGAEPRDRAGERAAPDEGARPAAEGGPPPGGDLGGLPAGVEAGRGSGELRGLPELGETFDRRPLADNQARLTLAVRRELARIVDELETFPFTNDTWNDLAGDVGLHGNVAGGHMERVKGGGGAVVYHDILAFSPLNLNAKTGKAAQKARGSRADVGAAVLKVLKTGDIHNNLAEGAVRVAEHRAIDDWTLLTSDITVLPHKDAPLLAMPELDAQLEDEQASQPSEAAEPEGAVDTSFRPEEFEQGAKPAQADLLETGETQPRLPGDVGEVRETDVATPQLEAPFALTSEVATRKGKQDTLFQSPLGQLLQKLPQGTGDEARGSIAFDADRQATINLFARADLSTFLHESGHFFVEVMADLASQPGASAQIQTDIQTLLTAAGHEGDLATWRALNADGRRDVHEQLARSFEAYLMEGKAPSAELRPVFARFRAWLLSVYRSLRSLNVTLTPEVRGVFDRLLASDAAIAEAEQQGAQRPLWLTPALAGMPPEQFAKYQDRIAAAGDAARSALEQQLLSEVRREQTATWKAQRAAIEATVTSEVHAQPVYQALTAMQAGTHPDGTPLVEGEEARPVKLDRQAIVDQFGEDRLKTLPRPYVYTREGGVHPDLMAETYGFSSGDELLTAVAAAPKMADAIKQETDRRMLAEHGTMLLDGTLPEQAQAATANDAHEDVIKAELTQLAKIRKGGPARIRAALPRADRVRAFASARIAATRVSEVRPQVFWAAARRAATQAIELAAKQDIDGTIVAKQQELVNIALYREAMRVQADVEARVQRARDLGKGSARERLGRAGESYLDQVDGILDRYQFARVSDKVLERRASLRKWAAALEGEGLPVDFPEELLDEARRVNYRELTVEQLVGVSDSLDHIAHLARLKNKLLKAEDQREFAAARDGVVASILEHNERQTVPIEFRGSVATRWIAGVFASSAKISMLARSLDGHVDGGAMWEAFIRPINAAADAEVTRQNETGTAYHAMLEQHYPGRELARLNDKQFIPAINASLSKEGRLAVALNWGNQTSRDRILSDPTLRWNEAQVQAVLDTLDERDWRFVQDTWDFLDQFWPEIAAKQRRVTGTAPEKVEAIPVRTKFGELRGGYYPLAYDGRKTPRAKGFEPANEAKLAASAAYVRTTTRRGHVEARQENVQLAVRLDLGVAFQHLDQVIHDLTHHEMLIDTTRLLRDRKIAGALYESKAMGAKGDLLYEQFTTALQDIAMGSRGNGAPSVLDTAATFLRQRTQIAGMAWNLWTALQQPLGLFNGMSRVGVKWVAKGMTRWLRDAASMENTATWIAEVSPMMRARVQTATEDLHDVRQRLKQPGGWFDNSVRTLSVDTLTQQTILDGYLWHIGMAQRVADIPTWLGQYEKSMAGGESEARAIALADQAVLDSQGGGQIKDLAQIQRGGPAWKLFMTFFSYGNMAYNSQAERVSATTSFKSPSQVLTLLGHLTLLGVLPAMGIEAMRCPTGRADCHDWPSYFKNVAGQYLGDQMNMMVGLREFGGLVKIFTGDQRDATRGYEGPAALRPIQLGYQLAQQIHQGKADEGFFKALNQVGGIAFKYPAAQVQRTVDGFIALEHGKTRNPAALLFGPPPKKAGGR